MSFGEPVVIIRVSGATEDDHGDVTPGTESRTTVEGCAVAPLKSPEDESVDGARLVDGFTVYFPAGTDVLASDTVEVRGGTYHVAGAPGVWSSPYGTYRGGVEVQVRRS